MKLHSPPKRAAMTTPPPLLSLVLPWHSICYRSCRSILLPILPVCTLW